LHLSIYDTYQQILKNIILLLYNNNEEEEGEKKKSLLGEQNPHTHTTQSQKSFSPIKILKFPQTEFKISQFNMKGIVKGTYLAILLLLQ
jgi:hypothetical protein